jgi:ATP-dependent Lon protease
MRFTTKAAMPKEAGKPIALAVPILPMRDSVAFPHTTGPIAVNRPRSRKLVENLPSDDPSRIVGLFLQRDATEVDPSFDHLHPIGTLARVLHVASVGAGDPNGYVVLAAGLQRVRVTATIAEEPYLRAKLATLDDIVPDHPDAEYLALRDSLRKLFVSYAEGTPGVPGEIVSAVANVEDAGFLADVVAAALSRPAEERQALLQTTDVRERMRRLVETLVTENDKLDLEKKIQSEAREKIAGNQREYMLREQLAAIQRELKEGAGESPGDDLASAIRDAGMPDEARKEAERELGRLAHVPEMSAEYGVIRSYLEWLTSLPWHNRSGGEIDLQRARRILDDDHHDLEKVKERMLEYLAVLRLRQLASSSRAPSAGAAESAGAEMPHGAILCFVGPPGVGKTSLGISIARALTRRFARISLGGVHDEGELRGHRRTYVGAMPGQIIQTLRRVGTGDPVLMLDEVDKLGSDFRGDPTSALLEVLDPEQNRSFRDHYLDVPFDLSHILFICTANVLDPVPPALIDRMEVLQLGGYSEEEKLAIARRYLVPKQVKENGLPADQIEFREDGLREIIRHHTREAGVRELERQIAGLCRKQAKRLVENEGAKLVVTAEAALAALGAPRYHVESEVADRTRRPGVAVGLAWTPAGGEILFVEASLVPGGHGAVTLTGQLGQVMQESARAAITWLHAHGGRYGTNVGRLKGADVHIHVPAGAVPKDGPSAGLVLVAALVSAASGQPVRPDVALTGEITLSGDVLPVGGIREKVLAARRSGISELVLPRMNDVNVAEDIPPSVREDMAFHFVDDIDDALSYAFERLPGYNHGQAGAIIIP